jgi:DUF1009 family protein
MSNIQFPMSNIEVKETIGLIAGEGRLPFIIAEGVRRAGMKLVCVGLADSVDEALAKEADVYYDVPLARPGIKVQPLKSSQHCWKKPLEKPQSTD